MQQYLFGDTEVAAERLKVLAEVFADSTRAFVTSAVGARPQLVVDLGCGPGYCTHLLAETLRAPRTVGLDNSEHFLSLARQTETENVSFCLHDVSSVPFPAAPADLAYCRFLLSHLLEPRQVVARWATQLRPKGLLLIEEVEAIHTTNRVFTEYLGIVEALLADQLTSLYVGPVLAGLGTDDACTRRDYQVKRLPVANHDAARMFFLNLQSWKHKPFIQANLGRQEMTRLEESLCEIANDLRGAAEIEWQLRQVTLEHS